MDNISRKFNLTPERFNSLYQDSINSPGSFWAEMAKEFITWIKPWHTVSNCDFQTGEIHWYQGGQLNACYNCIDRHLPKNANNKAIIWEGNNPSESTSLTYQELHEQVSKLANILQSLGVQLGDRVCIYLPMIPEIVISMLACARIGAIHTVVFGGFATEALRSRLLDSQAKVIITANETARGDKTIKLKDYVDAAINNLDFVEKVLVIKGNQNSYNIQDRDLDYTQLMSTASNVNKCVDVDAEHPLFMLYTSGSTGKPKGIQHSTGGYLTYAASTFNYVFDYHSGDIYWCSADAGWITGHSYVVYGPLTNGATIVLYEGIPTYPDASRMWQIIDKYKVNIFYTAPTLIRLLIAQGDEYLQNTSRASLRILGTVGEPINPETWQWFYDKVGAQTAPIVDTWWQTETGGILISPIPGVTELVPGSATKPLFGIKAVILDPNGVPLEGECEGLLAISASWPGQMQTIYNDHKRFVENYFAPYPGYYFSGDGARRDAKGNYWITGRVDDVLKVSGHRIGTAEIENALVENQQVAEAAVVGVNDNLKGESVYAYVLLKGKNTGSEALKQELILQVRTTVGPFAAPQYIQFVQELPKTRSGKIMRRILRKIANQDTENLGDLSTINNEELIKKLIVDNNSLR